MQIQVLWMGHPKSNQNIAGTMEVAMQLQMNGMPKLGKI